MLGIKLKLRIRQQIRTRLNVRFVMFAIISTILFGATISCLLLLNLGTPEKGIAGAGSDELSTGDIICRFTWETESPTKSAEGPDAISVSKSACITNGGRSSTKALNPGKPGTPINLLLPGSPYFNVP